MQRRRFLQFGACTAGAVVVGPITGLAASPDDGIMLQELRRHKVADISVKQIRLNYPRLVGKNARSDVHGTGVNVDAVEITTDQGAKGWGMMRDYEHADAGKVFIKGKKVSEIFSPAAGTLSDLAGPFDFVLHDLAGVILGKPVYQLVGKVSAPVTTRCYSGMIYFDDLEPASGPGGIDAVIKNCEWDYKFGYRQFKLKLGRGHKWMSPAEGMRRDIEVTKAVAGAFPDCEIMIDPNDRYTVDTTIEYLTGIGDVPLFWIEEPFKENVSDYSRLKIWLDGNGRKDTLIADGEWAPDLPLAMELGKKKLLQVYLEDISNLGFTKWRTVNPALKSAGIMSSPHCWGDLLKTYYTSHLIGGQGNSPSIEGVTCITDQVDFSNYKMVEGNLVPPSVPGFGMKLL